jgi:NAD(P)-dependent dehydrogenase (short-subunit alcohol dehydrogenase family)
MGKTWLITGASSGLGRLMTERLLARGDHVVATAQRGASLADLQREHGDRLVVPVLDLTDTTGIRRVLASAFRQLGRIDVLVSNAGAMGYSARPRRSRMRKSIIRLRPILSAPSNSSARPFRTCGSKAAAALFKFHPKAARSRTRPSVCITQPNGASKAYRIRRSGSRVLRNRFHCRRTRSYRHQFRRRFGARLADRHLSRIRPLVRGAGLLLREALPLKATLGAQLMP